MADVWTVMVWTLEEGDRYIEGHEALVEALQAVERLQKQGHTCIKLIWRSF